MMNRFRGLERAILSLNAPSSRIGRGKETRFFPFATGFVLGIGGVSCLAFAEENKSGTEDKDSGSWVDQTWNSVIGYGSKISKDILGLQKGVTEPLMNKFLPDPIPDSFGRVPRTVVLDFEGTLVNLDWNVCLFLVSRMILVYSSLINRLFEFSERKAGELPSDQEQICLSELWLERDTKLFYSQRIRNP